MTDKPQTRETMLLELAILAKADRTRLAVLQGAIARRTQHDQRPEPTDEFLLRMLDTMSDSLREAEAIIGELQKLVVNVSGWVSRGCSETATAAMDAAMHDGWAAMGWRGYIDRRRGSFDGGTGDGDEMTQRKQKCCPTCGTPLFTNRFHSCALVYARRAAEKRTKLLMDALKKLPKPEPLYEDETP